jgi:ribosomal protein L32
MGIGIQRGDTAKRIQSCIFFEEATVPDGLTDKARKSQRRGVDKVTVVSIFRVCRRSGALRCCAKTLSQISQT